MRCAGWRPWGAPMGRCGLWGSVSFIAGTFGAGYISDVLPARDLIWLIVAAAAALLLAGLALAPLPGVAGQRQPPRPAPKRHLLRDPAFLAALAAAALIQSSHAVYYGFSALAWRAAGLSGTTIAALWALGVVAEIVLFAAAGPAAAPVRADRTADGGRARRRGALGRHGV